MKCLPRQVNKRNNLLFYGLKEERRESASELLSKVGRCEVVRSLSL